MHFRYLALFLLCGLTAAITFAAPAPAPPAPDEYTAQVRYSIFAYGNQRVGQFNEMAVVLREAGFVRAKDDAPDDEADNPKYTRMLGTIPRKGVPKLLGQRHIRSLLLHP